MPIYATSGIAILEHRSYDVDFIDQDDLKVWKGNGNFLGAGKYGKVRRGVLIDAYEETTLVAIKIPHNHRVDESQILAEAEMMRSLCHENVLGIFGVCRKYDLICIVLEYMMHGSLIKYLNRYKKKLIGKNIPRLLEIGRDVAMGMAYLESRGVVHRDLAARNVLIHRSGVAKISDFGIARQLPDRTYYTEEFPRLAPIETRKHGQYTIKSDIWMCGILLWQIFTGCFSPVENDFADDDGVWWNGIFCKKVLMQPDSDYCTQRIYQIMLHCWAENSKERPTFKKLIKRLQPTKNEL